MSAESKCRYWPYIRIVGICNHYRRKCSKPVNKLKHFLPPQQQSLKLKVRWVPCKRTSMVTSYIRIFIRQSGILYAVRSIWVDNALRHCRVQFVYRAVIFPAIVWEPVMPKYIIFHKGNALAFYSIRNYNRWLVPRIMRIGKRRLKCFMIVAVQLYYIPTERTPLCAKILKLESFFAGIKALHMVMVNYRHQIFKAVLVCEQRRFIFCFYHFPLLPPIKSCFFQLKCTPLPVSLQVVIPLHFYPYNYHIIKCKMQVLSLPKAAFLRCFFLYFSAKNKAYNGALLRLYSKRARHKPRPFANRKESWEFSM